MSRVPPSFALFGFILLTGAAVFSSCSFVTATQRVANIPPEEGRSPPPPAPPAPAPSNGTTTPTTRVKRVSTIILPTKYGQAQGIAAGLREMYYTQQGNGTLVALNLTSQVVQFVLYLENSAGFKAFDNQKFSQSVLLVTYEGGSTNLDAFDAVKGTFLYSIESTVSLSPTQGEVPPAYRYFNGSVYYGGLAGFESVDVGTGIVKPNLVPLSISVNLFPVPFGGGTTAELVRSTCYAEFPFGTSFALGLLSYNFVQARTEWILLHAIHRGFLGQDETYIYADNTTAGGEGRMLVYNASSLALVATINGLSGVGFNGLISPQSFGANKELVTVLFGNEDIRLGVVNLTTGNLTETVHHISGLFHNPTTTLNTATEELVEWKDGEVTVYSYPGGQLLRKHTLPAGEPSRDTQSPQFAMFLPTEVNLSSSPTTLDSSHLLLGQWQGKVQVVDTVAGVLVFGAQNGLQGSGFNSAAMPYVLSGKIVRGDSPLKRQFVLVSGVNVEIFEY